MKTQKSTCHLGNIWFITRNKWLTYVTSHLIANSMKTGLGFFFFCMCCWQLLRVHLKQGPALSGDPGRPDGILGRWFIALPCNKPEGQGSRPGPVMTIYSMYMGRRLPDNQSQELQWPHLPLPDHLWKEQSTSQWDTTVRKWLWLFLHS